MESVSEIRHHIDAITQTRKITSAMQMVSSARMKKFTRHIPYNNLHCVVLAGEEGEQYRIADPMNGWQLVDKDVFWSSFDAMGLRAVTVGTEPFHNANLCRIHHVGSL